PEFCQESLAILGVQQLKNIDRPWRCGVGKPVGPGRCCVRVDNPAVPTSHRDDNRNGLEKEMLSGGHALKYDALAVGSALQPRQHVFEPFDQLSMRQTPSMKHGPFQISPAADSTGGGPCMRLSAITQRRMRLFHHVHFCKLSGYAVVGRVICSYSSPGLKRPRHPLSN